AFLMMLADSGKGLVIMGNSDSFFYITPRILDVVSREYGWKYTPPPEPGSNVLMLIENMVSPQAALDFYQQVKSSGSQEYKMDESSLNSLGYHLLMQKKTELAIKVFERNVQQYPNAWNPYDSLAEAYAAAGQKDLAIKNYEKSLALNPENKSGAEHLKKLQAEQ
ncbi:MAG TPA: tetratricopeptide repeat protein, partial [Candidatus Angelobacter sp.]|nr:tetratricopeptide repeat protein [Candidatus Angelobacter sp.]